MVLDSFASYFKIKWTEFFNRFWAKYFFKDVTAIDPPHSAELKIILNLLNFNFELLGTSILGEFKFTKSTYFMITYLLFVLVVSIYTLACVLDDILLLLQYIIVVGLFVPSAMKLLDLFSNNNGKFVSLVAFMLHVFKVNNHEKRAAILDTQMRKCKVYLLKIVLIFAFALNVYAAGAIYTIYLKQLPAPFYIPFVDRTSVIGYVVTLIVQIGGVMIACVWNLSYLMLFCLIVLHHDNLIALIQDDFKQLSGMTSVSRSERSVRRAFFIKIVTQIIETRRYTECIDDLYKRVVFWQTTMACLSVTVAIFLSVAFKWYVGTAGALYFLTEIYILSYLGQFMSNTNEKLARVIYFVDWVNYSLKEQKIILSLLHMTQFNCVEVWIGIFAPLCIETGFAISKSIYNYTMLLFELIDY